MKAVGQFPVNVAVLSQPYGTHLYLQQKRNKMFLPVV